MTVKDCLIEAINQTEFIGRGINKEISEDFSHRIKLKTGLIISPKRLFDIYRNRLKDKDISQEEKNAIAQFAQYTDWNNFISDSTKEDNIEKKFPTKTLIYLLVFMLSILIIIKLIEFLIQK